jgi:threonyl-tRNA synthetase
MKVTLKDGSVKEYAQAMSVIDIAKDLSEGLARAACAGEVDGEVVDLRTVVDHDAAVNILTAKDEKGLAALRHTTSHVMAQAVKRLYPNTKLAIGPSIADGFYYDMEFETPLTSDDFEKIEAEMKKIVKEDLKIERFTLPREKAIEFMKEKEEPYKVELIEDLPEGEEISFYQQGEFVDLCAGPHLMSTKEIGKAFKIMSLAGAYWRGDEHNQMLTRLYATAFAKKDELEAYITMMEEAKKRDHRKLGKELGLFMMHEAGPGFPFFLPKGMVLKNTLLDYWREIHRKAGYVEISSPVILNRSLWETSGHWDHYKNNMYTTVIDGEDYAIKPMNCPGGVLVYASEPRSYRDLPLRMGELGLVHRHEKSNAHADRYQQNAAFYVRYRCREHLKIRLGDGYRKAEQKAHHEYQRQIFRFRERGADLAANGHHRSFCAQRKQSHADDYHQRAYEKAQQQVRLHRHDKQAQYKHYPHYRQNGCCRFLRLFSYRGVRFFKIFFPFDTTTPQSHCRG